MYNRKLIITEEEKRNILSLHENTRRKELGLLLNEGGPYATDPKLGFPNGISEQDFQELVCSLVKRKYGFYFENGKVLWQSNHPNGFMNVAILDPEGGKKWNQITSKQGEYIPTEQNALRRFSIGAWLDMASPISKGLDWRKFANKCKTQNNTDEGGGGQRTTTTTPTIDQVKDCKNKRSFRQGMKGEPIKQIQGLLGSKYANILGTTSGNTYDGNFGPKTNQAVKQFQTDNGLTPDGIVGCNTLGKMLEILRSSVKIDTPVTPPNPDLAVGDQSSAVNLTQGNQSAIAGIGGQPGVGLQ